jgi:hypothetical protein
MVCLVYPIHTDKTRFEGHSIILESVVALGHGEVQSGWTSDYAKGTIRRGCHYISECEHETPL